MLSKSLSRLSSVGICGNEMRAMKAKDLVKEWKENDGEKDVWSVLEG